MLYWGNIETGTNKKCKKNKAEVCYI